MDELMERLQDALGDAFEIERELGGGGMSRLFVATERSLDRQVVVKVLSPDLTSDLSATRFKRESAVTAHLQHPHILPVLAAGARNGLLYYVMPYVAGESLRHRLTREGHLPVADAERLLREMADALAYAHDRGVVHRDIKPENILLQGDHAVLADFGIAWARGGALQTAAGTQRLTDGNAAMGTPGYMSPEQAAGEQNLDARSDIYALAVVGYEMLSGRPPFVGPTARSVITAHLSETPRPLAELRDDTPPALAAALATALAKAPEDRFQTAAEFRDALGTGTFAVATPQRRARRRRAWAAAAGVLALALGGVAAYARRGAATALDANLLAVAPFDVLDPRNDMWREGIVDVLSANLDGAGPLRTLSPTVAVRRWRGRADAETAGEFGRHTGARLTVFGRIVPAGADSVRLTATLWDVAAGRALGEFELRDASSRMDRVADSLTFGILRQLNQTRAIASVRQGALATTSLPALKAYLQGEQHFRRSDWDSAAFYYERALATDSTFAPALRHLSGALSWVYSEGDMEERYSYALKAGRYNRGLAPRESLLVVIDSQLAALSLAGKTQSPPVPIAKRLFATLDTATRRFPDDPEVWFKLGDARFHYLAFVPGESYARAREAFDRSLALDSAFAPSYIHPIDLAIRDQDLDGARRYIRRYLALDPQDYNAASVRLLAALIDPPEGGPVALDSVVAVLSPDAAISAYSAVMNWLDDRETAVRLARAMGAASAAGTRANKGAADGMPRRQLLPIALAYRGHVRQAWAAYDSLAYPVLPELALLGGVPADSADAEMRRWLDRPRPGRALAAMPWWVERRDTVSLARLVRRLETEQVPMLTPADLAGARAHLALARHDTTTAMAEFDKIADSVCEASFCYQYRLTKAQLLGALRRDAEASRLLANEYPPTMPSRVLWTLERGRVAERRGERDAAVDAYTFVMAAWERADASLQPAVAEARAGLRRLGADEGVGVPLKS